MKQIRHHLKHWFVAHPKNNHKPHLIRGRGLAVVAALIVAVQGASLIGHPASAAHGSVLAYATDINASDLFTLTNQARVANGLSPLRLDNRLVTSATLKANDMFTNDYWAHVSPSGVQPWYWFGQAGYSYSYAGENLAKDFDTSQGVMDGWMNSAGHRANILNPNYVDIGFAVENGTLVGGQTTLVVEHFGAPGGTSVVATVASPAPKPAAKVAAPVVTPVPTLAPTPAPMPAPTATPTPSPTGSPVQPTGSITEIAPAAAHYRTIAPLAVARSATPATLATIAILLALLLVYIQTHLIVWRKGLKRWRHLHYRLWAGGQVAALTVAVLVLASRGLGTVG